MPGTITYLGPYVYGGQWVVSKLYGPEESIQDKIDEITDAAADKRYKIEVMPGQYTENLTMKAYVDVTCPYGMAELIGTVAMASNSYLQGFRIRPASGTAVTIGVLANVELDECWISSGATDIGITDASTGTTVVIKDCRIDTVATGYQKTGTGTTMLADCRITSATDGIDVDVNAGVLNLYDNKLMGTGTGANVDVAGTSTINSYDNTMVGDGWQIADNANSIVYSHGDEFTKVTHAGAGYMTCQDRPNVWQVFNGMKIANAHTAASAGDSIEVGAGSYTEALTITKVITLVSLDGPERTTITQVNANVITLSVNATVEGFTIHISNPDAARTGIVCADTSAVVRNCVFTQLVTAGYGITATTGSPVIDKCTFTSGLDMAIYQTGAGGTRVSRCRVASGATNGISAEAGTIYVDTTSIEVAGNGLNAQTGGTIWATNSAITGIVIDCNVAALSTIIVEDCAYNDVTNAGTFVDLTGCQEYACAAGVTVGEWVYQNKAVPDVPDTVIEAKADSLLTMPAIGVVVYKPSDTRCKVKNYGYYYDSTDPWTTHLGDEYWISDTTAGAIIPTMPAMWPQRAGVPVAADRFKVLIGDNLGLKDTNEYLNGAGIVAVGNWVYITVVNDTVGLAQANVAATMPAIGVVVEVIDATHCRVRLRGKFSEATRAWTASDPVYISDAVAGDIVNVPPVMGIVQEVAEVKSDDGATLVMEMS